MNSDRLTHKRRESLLSAVSAGFFLVLIGLLFVMTPNLYDRIVDFFQDFTTVTVQNLNIALPTPAYVANHSTVYSAIEQFSLAWGVFLVALLVIRFASGSSIRKKAENLSDIVFWFGAAYVIQTWLIERAKWFEFWSIIFILLGVSLIVRAIFLASVAAFRR